MGLRNLLVSFDVAVTGLGRLKSVDETLKGVLNTLKGVSVGLRVMVGAFAAGALVSGITNFIEGTIKSADALFNQAAKLGMTTDELQKYQYAAAQFGITQTETAVAVRFFNRMIGEAQLGTKGAVKTMQQMGLSMAQVNDPTLTTGKALAIFSDKLEKMPNQFKRTAFVMRTLGRGGSSMLPILQQGSKKIREVFEDVDELGGGFNQKFAESSHKTEIALKRLRFAWLTIRTALVSELLPVFQWWIDSSIKTAKALIEIAKHTYGFRTALIMLAAGAVIAGVAFAAAMSPILLSMLPILIPLALFVALMGLLYIAFDDFYTFLKGGDSLLGRFLDRLGGQGAAKKFRQELVEAFHKVWDAISPLMPQLEKFGKAAIKAFLETIPAVIEWGGVFGTYIVQAIDGAITSLEVLFDTVVAIGKAFKDILSGNFSDAAGEITDLQGKVKEIVEGAHRRAAALAAARKKLREIDAPKAAGRITGTGDIGLPPPPEPPAAAGPHAMNIEIKNYVNGGGDPTGTARAVGQATKTAVKTALNEHRDTNYAVNMGMPQSGLG